MLEIRAEDWRGEGTSVSSNAGIENVRFCYDLADLGGFVSIWLVPCAGPEFGYRVMIDMFEYVR